MCICGENPGAFGGRTLMCWGGGGGAWCGDLESGLWCVDRGVEP